MRCIPVLFTCALLLSACDSANPPAPLPVVPSDPPAPGVLVVALGAVPTVNIAADAAPISIALRPLFRASTDANTLSFSAEAESGAVSVRVTADSLVIRPIVTGFTHVVMTARGALGGEAQQRITVQVQAALCPPGPASGAADFLQLGAGQSLRFRFYESSRYPSGHDGSDGTLTLTVTSAACSGGTRTMTAEERRIGRRWATASMGAVDTTALDVQRVVSISETSEGVLLPWTSGRVPRYHPAAADTVRVTAGFIPLCSVGGGTTVTLVPGALVAVAGSCNHASNGASFSLHQVTGG